ncbi:MAG: DMT family transporter [Candidatus Yanofskybacteria bacterium]|nr:DMT family transporter [Candidatus Yanofskybacteria bacterium]
MTIYGLGIIAAFGALIFWGVGDFLIQRSVRRLGDWEPLFIISLFGSIIITPFVWHDLQIITTSGNFILLITVAVTFLCASLLEFQGYKIGKLAVIEPIQVLEIPISAFLAFFLLYERPTSMVILLVLILIFGLVLISVKRHHFLKKSWLEKGIIFAIAASFFMGITNFLVAYSSRLTNPLIAIWFFNIFITLTTFIYLTAMGKIHNLFKDFTSNPKLMTAVCVFDNLAWISFAFASSVVPVITALAISESYIVLASILGIFYNNERLARYQIAGLFIVIPNAIILAIIA